MNLNQFCPSDQHHFHKIFLNRVKCVKKNSAEKGPILKKLSRDECHGTRTKYSSLAPTKIVLLVSWINENIQVAYISIPKYIEIRIHSFKSNLILFDPIRSLCDRF